MPELPEVEILVRQLRPQVVGQRIREVPILRSQSVRGASCRCFGNALRGRQIVELTRRGKYLRFHLDDDTCFLVHLGMTGRLHLRQRREGSIDKHDVGHIRLSRGRLIFHDPRKFGRLVLGDARLRMLGPEPLGRQFDRQYLSERLNASQAPIKTRLLDQALVAGLGNIYVCEALWRAEIDPRCACRSLRGPRLTKLCRAIRQTLRNAIRFGGGLSLNFAGNSSDGLFYYGSGRRKENPAEHFDVYDREGNPCRRCGTLITRIAQAGRSTFLCSACQRR